MTNKLDQTMDEVVARLTTASMTGTTIRAVLKRLEYLRILEFTEAPREPLIFGAMVHVNKRAQTPAGARGEVWTRWTGHPSGAARPWIGAICGEHRNWAEVLELGFDRVIDEGDPNRAHR